jgi:ubiquinone/menaquinone biosynthesis C-methylase UbiE
MTHRKFNDISAMDALKQANMIAVGPFVFQTVVALQKLGILSKLGELKDGNCLSKADIVISCGISEYTCGVLLDLAVVADIIIQNDVGDYRLSKVGMYLNDDRMTQVNFNFTRDVCYKGLADLTESLLSEKPIGLQTFTSEYDTIYPYLSKLPKDARDSWFDFDHFYSDHVFEKALPYVFDNNKVKLIYDVGGNTGKFAIEAAKYNEEALITIVDLPQQCVLAQDNIKRNGFIKRINTYPMNILDPKLELPTEADVWWMSQFLDCFSEEQISFILAKIYKSMKTGARLIINELFGDRQKNDIARLIIEANSLYFTALANGVSRFYHADRFLELLTNIGFKLESEHSGLGIGHTLLILTK